MALVLHVGVAQAQTAQMNIWPQQDLTLVGMAPSAARQTMLWAQRPSLGLDLSIGLGVEQRPRQDFRGIETMGSGLLIGVALNTSERTQLTLHSGLAPRDVRMGLVFRQADPLQELRRGLLLKVELSQQTTLAIKPRAGRVGILMSSSW